MLKIIKKAPLPLPWDNISLEEIELGEEGCGGTEASMFKKSTREESLQGLQSGERQVCSKQAPSRRCCVLKHLLHYSFGL